MGVLGAWGCFGVFWPECGIHQKLRGERVEDWAQGRLGSGFDLVGSPLQVGTGARAGIVRSLRVGARAHIACM
jgi:hypothetical protein